MRAAIVLAALLGSAALPSSPRADWAVKRQGEALLGQAVRSLEATPDQPGLAARIVRIAGKGAIAATLEGLRRTAGKTPPRYEAKEAYAQLLLAAGRFGEAADAFSETMKLRPDAVAPAAGRAVALAAASKAPEALTAYDDAIGREKRPAGKASLLRAVVALAEKAGAAEREIAARRELAALAPGSVTSALELAEALRRAGRPAEGAAALEKLLGDGPSRLSGARRAEVLESAAGLREAAGDDDGAERLLRESLAAGPNEVNRAALYKRITEIARRRDTLPLLAAHLERLVAGAGHGRALEWGALARVREELGDLGGALEAAKRAAEADPNDLVLRRQMLALLERLGRESDLMAAYEEIERRWPEDASFAAERIDRKFRLGDRDEARTLFDRALRTFRRNGEALANLADLASRWSEDDRVLAAWDAVLALSPRDERAIVGLGEAHFQRGRRELARRTWRALLNAVKPKAAAHARLAELLGDHDLLDEAIAEARTAQKLEPQNPHHQRTLARILERRKDYAGAMAEWRAVLAASQGAGRAAERREARSSLINLIAREGRARLDGEAVRLTEQLAKQPNDRETILFLAEVELRRMDPERALATLREAARRRPDDGEIVAALVRLLRQSRQLEEAIARLETLAGKQPDRAREAFMQIAEMELQRYADRRALEFAGKAAALASDDPDALARIGEIEERAGQPDHAIGTYRRALARGASAKAATALQRLLIRRGAAGEASQALQEFVRATTDEDARAEVLRGELDVDEYLGELEGFERLLVGLPGRTAASRKVAVALLQRRVPALYARAPFEPAAATELERLSRWGVRPLVELATDPDADPEPVVVELLGMLGSNHATPVLLRLAGSKARGSGARTASSTVQVTAMIALGRLKDARAVPLLVNLSQAPDAGVRAVALWALGRTRGGAMGEALERATSDPRAEVAAIAWLGRGRYRDARSGRALAEVATDLTRPVRVRRAAVLALGLAEIAETSQVLVPLLDAPDPALAGAAAAALGAIKDRRTLPALWERALLARGPSSAAALAALRAFAGPGGLGDDARAVRGARFEVDALLDALATPATPAGVDGAPELAALWIEYAADLEEVVARALGGGAELRRRALMALDARDDGPGLGPLTPGPLSVEATAALRALGDRLRDRVAMALDDGDATVRRLALRVASKLRDGRVSLSHLQGVLATGGPESEAAALLAARALVESGRAGGGALVDALKIPLADVAWDRRLTAVRVVRLGGAPARRELERALRDASPFVRAEAAEALADHEAATGALVAAAGDPVAAVRAAVARSLRRRSSPEAKAALRTLLGDEAAAVRQAASPPSS